MENKIFLMLVILSQVHAKVVNGLYVYEEEPFWGTQNWDQLIPLLKLLVPYVAIIGLPILVVLVIITGVKIPVLGVKISWSLFKEFLPKKKDKEEETSRK